MGVDGQLLKITASDADAILNKIDSAKFTPDPGHLYEIDVPDEDIAKMLDWDKPLSEQPESVRRQLLALEDKMDGTFWDNDLQALESLKGKMSDRTFTGEDLLGDLGEVFGHATGRETSEYLNSIGIPGIKYYDQGSRGAGEGTRNMVLFDDLARRAKVLKRNEETIAQPSVDEFIGKLLED